MPTVLTGIDYSGSATVDASGSAAVVLNGPSSGYVEIASIAVACTGSTSIPQATAYEGSIAAPGRVLAVLRAGDIGTFKSDGDRLNAGQQITVQWTGATVGASCRAVLRGKTVKP